MTQSCVVKIIDLGLPPSEFIFASSRSKIFQMHISDVYLKVILFCLDIYVNISPNNQNVGTCMLTESGIRHNARLTLTNYSQVMIFFGL